MRLPTLPRFFAASASVLSALALAACITINIYFPASAAEKAADKIIDEIWQPVGGASSTTSSPTTNDKTVKP